MLVSCSMSQIGIFFTIFARTSVALFVIRVFAVTQDMWRLLDAHIGFMVISLAVTGCIVCSFEPEVGANG